MTYLDTMVYVSNNLLLPLGGILIAVFSGWVLDRKMRDSEMINDSAYYAVWRVLTRFVAPLAVFTVFIMKFITA